jgi:DNA-directed RNA polymerase subunit beta'
MINIEHDFDYIRINLASPKRIREWSERILPNGEIIGEVRKSDTLNYRTFKPEIDGLFCEKIFGPIKNWECYCGKYKHIKPKKIFNCERCGVEITECRIRRHRLGYIELISPVTHVWYLKGIPSYLSLLLKYKLRTLEEIIYFNRSLKIKKINKNKNNLKNIIDFENECFNLNEKIITKNKENIVEESGAEAIEYLLERLDLTKELKKNRIALILNNFEKIFIEKKSLEDENYKDSKEKIIKRIRLIENFQASGSKPNWMILKIIPVIPPSLRPMIQLSSGRFATSDLNELYRRIIIRNNRLERLIQMFAPIVIIQNEKRLLQEGIDTLIDNGKRGKKAVDGNNRPLKSLSDIIQGKQGRFRQNLLGKRVDYSGRSVIIVGPSLKLNQCGLPHEIALEIFQPFIIHELLKNGLASNMRLAKRLINKGENIIWRILKSILKIHPVLLNRAPTLHRLGIQAFEPILVAGRAIQLHPLVCTAFNADFDGDQMAIHLPLSLKAQKEAKTLMLPSNNFLSAGTGEPIILPTQDMILGCYYLTLDKPNFLKNYNNYFSDFNDAILAYEQKKICLHSIIWIRIKDINSSNIRSYYSSKLQIRNYTNFKYILTTIGRILINKIISKNLQI